MNRPNNGSEEEAARIARQERAVEVVAAIKVARAFVEELCQAVEELAPRRSEEPYIYAHGDDYDARRQRIEILCREIGAQLRGGLEAAGELAQERPARARYSVTEAGREAIRAGRTRDEQAAAFLDSIAGSLELDAGRAREGTQLGAALRNEAARLRADADPLGPLGSGI